MIKLNWKQRKPKFEYSVFDDIIDQLAAINGVEDIETFLNPSYDQISDPYLLKSINEATDKIIKAIKKRQNISIFADADSDGENSTAIMYSHLKNLTDKVTYFYGSRSKGHGLHTMVDEIPEETQLLIVLDSSSSEWKECKKVKESGIDVIVIDHHLIENPNHHCILVNPQQDGCNYPNKEISCSALTWQVCRVIDDKLNTNYANEYIDLASIGLISDMMPMNNIENRAIVNLGLRNVTNIGLKSILKDKNLAYKKELSTTDIGFNVSNILNAAARMDKIGLALELLTTNTYTRAEELIKEINKLNTQRKKKQIVHTDFVKDKIDESQKIIIILDHKKEIGKNFAGLIANDVTKEYQRPCLILSPDEGEGKTYAGSYRSYGGFDLKAFFESTNLIDYAAGHVGAGGVGIKIELIDDFIKKVQESAKDLDFEQVLEYDLEFNLSDINEKLINEINRFYRITGSNFPVGKFLVDGIYICDVDVMGKNKDTVKIICGDDNLNGNFQLIKFRTSELFADKVPVYSLVKAVGTLGVNSFYNFQEKRVIKTNQLLLDDFKVVS